MADNTDNKRIAKNALYLYLRMFVLLAIGLYTSRVVLIALGVADYGVYNVVGGVVSMFVFINYAMINSTQRYITYELGAKNEEKLKSVFSTSINIHVLISLIIVILSETIGLWFFYNKMVIPDNRFLAAFWVFQFSILSCVVNVVCVPFNALIIAHEKMSAFAYISLFDAVLKLFIVYFVLFFVGDRLVLYAFLLFCVSFLNFLVYYFYCKHKFMEASYHYNVNKPLMCEMVKFASWNLLGNLSYVCYTQGLNLLLNVFFNPIVNAARGIAVQVSSVVSNFSYSVENAIKPQITKSYAKGELQRMHSLIFVSARLSFYLLLLISMPIVLETEQIMHLWLVEVPDHTFNFIRLTIAILLVDVQTNPLLIAAQATGDMKKYQLTVSLLCFLILPISYVSLLFHSYPEIVFIVNLGIVFIVQFVKLWIVGRQINLSIYFYTKNVFLKSLCVMSLSCVLTIPFVFYMDANLYRLFFVVIYSCLVVFVLVYTIGITREERVYFKIKIVDYINKNVYRCH